MSKLISTTPSPFARKVRIALVEKNLPFELLSWRALYPRPAALVDRLDQRRSLRDSRRHAQTLRDKVV